MAFISSDEDTLRLYELREKAMFDYTSGIDFAKRESIREMVKNLLKENVDKEIIARVTGLDEATIKQLQADLKE